MATEAKENKPKPCCVCIDQRKARDECLLFNTIESGKCDDILKQYTDCMKSYGFTPNPVPKSS